MKRDKITKPSQQEIQDQLAGMNRTQQAAHVSSDTEAARAKGIANYQKWFKRYGIPIRQNNKDIWELAEVLDDIGAKEK